MTENKQPIEHCFVKPVVNYATKAYQVGSKAYEESGKPGRTAACLVAIALGIYGLAKLNNHDDNQNDPAPTRHSTTIEHCLTPEERHLTPASSRFEDYVNHS